MYMEDIKKTFPATLEEVPVRLLKLVSGESIIAYVHDNNEGELSLEEPMRLSVEDDQQLVFTPYLPFSEEQLHHIDMENVMFESEVSTDIKAYYMKILLDQIEGIDTPDQVPAIATLKGTSTVH